VEKHELLHLRRYWLRRYNDAFWLQCGDGARFLLERHSRTQNRQLVERTNQSSQSCHSNCRFLQHLDLLASSNKGGYRQPRAQRKRPPD
jgi:hypothetical protein